MQQVAVGRIGEDRAHGRERHEAIPCTRTATFTTLASALLPSVLLHPREQVLSDTRIAFAIAVSAGFTAPMLGKKLVSTT